MSPQSRQPSGETKAKFVLVYGSVAPDVCNACVLHLTGIANALSRQGLNVTVMTPHSEPTDPLSVFLRPEISRVGFPWPKVLSITVWTLGPLFSFGKFRRVIMETKPDILYVRMGLLTWILHWYADKHGIFSVAEHNGVIAIELSQSRLGKLIKPVAQWFQLLSCVLASRSRVVTGGMLKQLIELGADEKKLFVLGNGTDVQEMQRLDRSHSLKRLGLSEDKFYVGFLGSLSWWQGVHTLVKAVDIARKHAPNIHLLIGGSGSEEDNLKAQVASLKMEGATTFLGYVGHDTRLEVLSAMDIATLPACAERNKDQGVSPLKVRDYAAVGSVIVAADLPGLEHMSSAEGLILHVPDDAEDLARKLVELYGDDKKRANLSRQSRSYAEQFFSWEPIAAQIARLREEGERN